MTVEAPPVPLTHGESLRGTRTEAFRLLETRHHRGMRVARHEHERACVNFVVDGLYDESTDAGPAAHGALTSLYKPASEPHANHFRHGAARCLLVESNDAAALGLDLHGPSSTRDPRAALAGLRLWHELARADECSTLTLDELGLELWERTLGVAARADPGSERLRAARDALHASSGAPWSLARLAAEVGLHPSHLARAFRARHGRTLGEYLRELRVARVARALLGTDAPVAELAQRAGFSDQSHCTRAFRRLVGTTPAAWRAAARAGRNSGSSRARRGE